MRHSGVLPGLAILGIVSAASSIPAQTIRAKVVESETGEPVPAAAVLASWADGDTIGTTISSSTGTFSVRTLRSGRIVLRVERIGFRTIITEPIQVGTGDIASVDLEMTASPVALEPIVVRVTSRPAVQGTLMDAFRERRYWLGEMLGLGYFLNQDEIEARQAVQLSDLLKTLPGVRLVQSSSYAVRYAYDVIIGRMPGCEQAKIYLDGMWMNRGGDDLDTIAIPSMLAGVEVYRGLAQLPPEFAGFDSSCGVIVLWSKRGS